jgi:hypothetical protein
MCVFLTELQLAISPAFVPALAQEVEDRFIDLLKTVWLHCNLAA